MQTDGWDVTFLGGSLPADGLQRYAGVTEPDGVVISCPVALFLSGARRCVAAVAELGRPAMAAGAAFGHDDVRALRLGTRGWIGPTANLTAALDEFRTPPQATPIPSEVFAMELAVEDLQRSCLTVMGERMPQLAAYSPAQLASTRADIAYIFSYLAAAVDVGDDEIFKTFTSWLTRVLERVACRPSCSNSRWTTSGLFWHQQG